LVVMVAVGWPVRVSGVVYGVCNRDREADTETWCAMNEFSGALTTIGPLTSSTRPEPVVMSKDGQVVYGLRKYLELGDTGQLWWLGVDPITAQRTYGWNISLKWAAGEAQAYVVNVLPHNDGTPDAYGRTLVLALSQSRKNTYWVDFDLDNKRIFANGKGPAYNGMVPCIDMVSAAWSPSERVLWTFFSASGSCGSERTILQRDVISTGASITGEWGWGCRGRPMATYFSQVKRQLYVLTQYHVVVVKGQGLRDTWECTELWSIPWGAYTFGPGFFGSPTNSSLAFISLEPQRGVVSLFQLDTSTNKVTNITSPAVSANAFEARGHWHSRGQVA